jgi:hypothetical protein
VTEGKVARSLRSESRGLEVAVTGGHEVVEESSADVFVPGGVLIVYSD